MLALAKARDWLVLVIGQKGILKSKWINDQWACAIGSDTLDHFSRKQNNPGTLWTSPDYSPNINNHLKQYSSFFLNELSQKEGSYVLGFLGSAVPEYVTHLLSFEFHLQLPWRGQTKWFQGLTWPMGRSSHPCKGIKQLNVIPFCDSSSNWLFKKNVRLSQGSWLFGLF